MFTIQASLFGPFELYELRDPATGALARVVPGYGATLTALELPAPPDGAARAVLVGPPDAAGLVHDPKYRGALLLPFVNRIRDGRYSFEGQPHHLPCNEPTRNVALHGFGFHQPFAVTAADATADAARLALAYDAPGDAPGYPFPFRAEAEYELTATGLTLTLRVRNAGPTALPLGAGWHPYFHLGGLIDELVIQAPIRAAVQTDPDRLLPTGELEPAPDFANGLLLGSRFIDQSFALNLDDRPDQRIETTLFHPPTNRRLTLWQDAGPNQFRYLHFYTDPSRAALAVEPVTSAPDAFNTGQGLIQLEPGATFEARWGVRMGNEQPEIRNDE